MKNIIIASFLTVGMASAATYHIDLGHSSQETTGNYNNMSAGTAGIPNGITGLVDSSGGSSVFNVAYSRSGDAQMAGTGANFAGAYPATVATQPTSALQDGLYIKNGVSAILTFSNLDDSLTYDFIIYGARGNSGGSVTYSIGGESGSIANVLNNGTTAISLSGISPTSNEIVLTALGVAGNGNDGALNYVQLTAVPEPSSAALLGLGGVALILRRRK